MITYEQFKIIDIEVSIAVSSTFDLIKSINEDNYILYIANAEYLKNWNGSRINPYVIDYKFDHHKDISRIKFLIKFIKTYYAFPNKGDKTDDSDEILHLEMMMYSHIWESKLFLKKLKRLSILVDNRNYSYPWMVEIPDMGKHDLIRNEICNSFKQKNLNISNVIKKGFHTSLRNAFAHSEYYFDTNINTIYLENYKGDNWELKNIKYNDWTIRFVYSFLLNY
jgi:hypothetical protein